MRQKYILEMNSAKSYGYEQGEKNKQLEIAKNLKNQNIDIQIIISATGLTKEEIEKL